MQQYINQDENNKTIDYIESFRTIQALYPLSSELRDRILNQGFTLEQVENFLDIIDIDIAILCFILNISGFDMHRIFTEKRFNRQMSVKILAVAEIYACGYHAFQSRRLFNNWMKRESFPFHFVSPLSLLNTPEGIQEVGMRVRKRGDTAFH